MGKLVLYAFALSAQDVSVNPAADRAVGNESLAASLGNTVYGKGSPINLFKFFRRRKAQEAFPAPAPEKVQVTRSEHNISRSNISENALKVLYRLKKAGYQSYLVGGGVRDLLLGREPKDFDVATDATPEDVKRLFRNCRLVGRRFRIAHVHFGPEIIEVTTFRGKSDDQAGDDLKLTDEGRILRDNVFGTIEEDAWRRDFSVNALYYNIEDFSVSDFTGGMTDLKAGTLRLIGDPQLRYREDPVRMLRAVRFAAKLGFRLDDATEHALFEMGHLLQDISPSRLFDETLKLFLSGHAVQSFELMRHYRVFEHLYPYTEEALSVEEQHFPLTLVLRAMENTDARIAEGKPVTPAFLYGALLWEPMRRMAMRLQEENADLSWLNALQSAGSSLVTMQARHTAIPKRFSIPMREIWNLQAQLRHNSGKRALRVAGHPRFRAGYDFLLLRAESGEEKQELADWWTRFQELEPDEQHKLASEQSKGQGKKRRRRPRKRRSSNPATNG